MYHQIISSLFAFLTADRRINHPEILGVSSRDDDEAMTVTRFAQHTRRLHNRTTDSFDPSVNRLPFLGAAWAPDYQPAVSHGLDLVGVALLAVPLHDAEAVHAWVACAEGVGLHATFQNCEATTTVLTPDNTDRTQHQVINGLEWLRSDITGTKPVIIQWPHDCWPWQACERCGHRNAECTCPRIAPPHHT